MGNGWMGSYCWPMGEEGRRCEQGEDWSELSGAETYGMLKGPRNAHIIVIGVEARPGRVNRTRMFRIKEEGTLSKPGMSEVPGEEAFSLESQEEETIAQFVTLDIPEGLYLIIVSYELPLGEVDLAFKVQLLE